MQIIEPVLSLCFDGCPPVKQAYFDVNVVVLREKTTIENGMK